MAKPTDLNEKGFEEKVLQAEGPALVDFWAPWCGPCRMVAPVVEELAGEFAGRISFFKVNTDENPAVAARYSIRSIPTLLLFKQGKPVEQVVGYRPKAELKKVLEKALA